MTTKQVALEYQILHRIVARVKLLSNRWPCPFCGRKSIKAELVSVDILRSDGVRQSEGCWYCNLEPLIEEAEKALEHRRKHVEKKYGRDIFPDLGKYSQLGGPGPEDQNT